MIEELRESIRDDESFFYFLQEKASAGYAILHPGTAKLSYISIGLLNLLGISTDWRESPLPNSRSFEVILKFYKESKESSPSEEGLEFEDTQKNIHKFSYSIRPFPSSSSLSDQILVGFTYLGRQEKSKFSGTIEELESIMNSLVDIIFEVSADHVFLNFWGNNTKSLYFDKSTFLGRKIQDVFDENSGKQFADLVDRAISTGETQIIEYPSYIGKDRFYSAHFNRINSSVPKVSIFIKDITSRKNIEINLRNTNQRLIFLDSFLRYTYDLILISDSKGDLKYINNTASQRLGIPLDSFENYNVKQFEPLFREEIRWEEHLKFLKERQVIKVETENINIITGDAIPVEVTVRYNEIEGSPYVIAIARDITERKINEKVLRETKELLEKTGIIGNIGAWEYNLSNKRIYLSEVSRIIFSDMNQEFRTLEEFSDLLEGKQSKDLFNNSILNAIQFGNNFDLELYCRDIHSNYKWIRMIGSAEIKEKKIYKILGVIQDITNIKSSHIELEKISNRLKIAINISRFGIWEWNPSRKEYLPDLMMLSILPTSAGMYENLFDVWEAFVLPEDRVQIEKHFRELLEENRPIDINFRINSTREQTKYLRMIAISFQNNHQETIIGTTIDITDEKLREESLNNARNAAEIANTAKSDFLATMSHEIRTPLNGVLGLTEVMLETELNSDQKIYMESIQKAGTSLKVLIDEILDYSKIEAGKMTLENISFSFEKMIQDLIYLFSVDAKKKNLSFEYNHSGTIPQLVKGDEYRIRQILSNLINNAIKFTNTGTVRIQVSCQPLKKETHQFLVEVEDTGIGISVESQDLLFQKFTQADTSTTRKFGGSGLGLAICKSLSELMGGTLSFLSVPGRGSLFKLSLDLEEVKLEPKSNPGVEKPNLETFDDDFLLVEDNDINILVVQKMLKKHVRTLDVAKNGVEAIQMALSKNYKIIFMDCQMPEMDGYTATRVLREKENIKTTIIALTANATDDSREKCLGSGMDDFLSKPITKDSILNMIKKYSGD